jgi:HEAT repeat protein
MLRMFHTPRTLMFFAVKQGIGFVPLPGVGEGVSSLTLLLSDASVSGRATTILLMANDKSPEVVRALREALKDKDASVRAAAAHAMALRDDPTHMNELVPLLDDPKDSVRLRAAAGYVRLAGLRRPATSLKKR